MTPTVPDGQRTPLAWRQQLWFGVSGLLGAGWLWFVLSRHGIGLSPDSVGYLAVAQHLLEGRGFLSYRDEPFVAQPPLYPLALATLSFCFGLPPTTSAFGLNLLLFALVIYLSGQLTFRITKSLTLSIATCISVIFGVPIFWISIFAWSELLFIFFTLLTFSSLLDFAPDRDVKALLRCTFFAGCSFLTRYAGLFTVLALFIYFALLPDRNLRPKINRLILFSLASLFFLSPWMARNYVLSGTLFGPRIITSLKIDEILFLFGDVFLSWFIFPTLVPENNFFLLVLFALQLLVFYVIGIIQSKNQNLSSFIIFVAIYSLLIFISSVRFAYDPVDSRLLSPVFIPLVITLLSFSYQVVYPYLKSKVPRRVQSWFTLSGALVWFTCPVLSTLTLGLEVRGNGQGYHAVQWQTSETVTYVRQTRAQLAQLTIYTNDPEGLYFLTGIRAEHLPFRVRPTWPEVGKAYVIRFKQAYRGECLDIIEKLRQAADIQPVAQFSDGEIYLVTHKNLRP